MSLPDGCPEWEYTNLPDYSTKLYPQLLASIAALLQDLRDGKLQTVPTATNTRSVHRRMFKELTPSGHDYFAGNYRGAEKRCLKPYRVGVLGDPRVGAPPEIVASEMKALATIVEDAIAGLDAGHQISDMTPAQKIRATVAAACHIFQLFLTIHPYANGNGHTARFLIWAILGRYGYWPERWSIDPKPHGPYYTALIAHRNGDTRPLEAFVLRCLGPASSPA